MRYSSEKKGRKKIFGNIILLVVCIYIYIYIYIRMRDRLSRKIWSLQSAFDLLMRSTHLCNLHVCVVLVRKQKNFRLFYARRKAMKTGKLQNCKLLQTEDSLGPETLHPTATCATEKFGPSLLWR